MEEEEKQVQEQEQVVDDVHIQDTEDEVIIQPVETKEEGEQHQEQQANYDSVLSGMSSLFNEGVEGEEAIRFDIGEENEKNFSTMSTEEKRTSITNAIVKQMRLAKDEKTDEIVKNLINLSYEEGFNIDEILKPTETDTGVFKWEENSLDESFKFAYTKTYGKGTSANMTAEEIDQEVDSQSIGFKKAFVADFRKGEEQAAQQAKINRANDERDREQKFLIDYNNKTKGKIEELVNKSKEQTIFSGYAFSQADKDDYLKMLPSLLERKVVEMSNGDRFAMSEAEALIKELATDGQSIMKLAPFLYLYKTGKLDAYSTMLTNKVKEEFLERLDENPEQRNLGNRNTAQIHIQDTED